MTGYGPFPVGAYTLRKRQSSFVEPVPNGFWSWTQPLPNLVASRTPVSGAAFWGAFQRRGPTGGAAYGMPSKLRIVAVLLPAIIPTFGTVTTSDTEPPSAGGVAPPPLLVELLLHAKQTMAMHAASSIRAAAGFFARAAEESLATARALRTKPVRARRELDAMRV